VHFRSANEDGLKLGRIAGAKVFDRIKPLPTNSKQPATTTEQAKRPATGRRFKA